MFEQSGTNIALINTVTVQLERRQERGLLCLQCFSECISNGED